MSENKWSYKIKSLSIYYKLVKKGWLYLNLRDDEEITYSQALQLMNYLNIFLVNIQSIRLFDAVNIRKNRLLEQSEFINFLIAYDIIGETMKIDILDTLKLDANDEVTNGVKDFQILLITKMEKIKRERKRVKYWWK